MEGMSFSSSFLPGHDDRPTAMKESISSVEGNPVFTLQASYQCGSSPSSPNTASKCSSPFLQHVVASSDVSRLCVSSSSRSLLLFDPRTFRPVDTRHEAHTSQITDITFLSSSPSLLASSSQDGTLRLWDFRLSSSSTTTTAPCVGTIRLAPAGSKEAEVWSVAVNSSDRLIAGGCKSSFFLFDLRRSFSSFSSSPNQVSCNSGGATTLSNTDMQALSSPSSDLSTLVKRKKKNERHKGQTPEVGVQQALARIEVHSDTVTCLLFHPWLESILFSGGEDHVVCIHDVSLKKDKGAYSSPSSSSFLEGVEDTTNGPHILRSIDPTHRDTTPYARHVEEEEDGDLTMVSCFSHGRPVKKISVLGPQDDCLCVASPMEDIALWQLAGLSAGRHACLRSPMKGSTPHGFGEADQDEECASMEAETGCATDCPFRGEMAMRSTDSYDSTDSSMWTAQGENNEVRKMHGAVHLIDKKADWLNLRLQPSLVCGESGGYLVDSFYDEGSGRLFFLAGSVSGTLGLFHANLDGLVPAASFFTPLGQQAHTAVVRDAATVPFYSSSTTPTTPSYFSSGLTSDSSSSSLTSSSSSLPSCLLVTCGEDGRLCAWKQATSGFAVESSSASSYGKCSKDFSMRNHRWPRGCLTNEKGGAMKRRPFCTPY